MTGSHLSNNDEKPQKTFSSVVGIIFSCLGCVIGTGNIWRFPRIVARNSGQNGAACFFIIWFMCLFLWSIPLLVIEYAIGRYVRKSPIRCFVHFFGKFGIFLGGWVTFINFFIGSYYTVILGWCLYYIYLPMRMELPLEVTQSQELFNSFVQSYWSFIPYSLSFLIISASVVGGIKVIEKVNIVLVPLLLAILFIIFFYSTTLQYSEFGFHFLFSADWKTLTKPSLYLDAISQNAFDTAAASGLITAYAMYLTRSNSIVRYSLCIPIINNFVSLLASMTIFPAVFGLMLAKTPTMTENGIVSVIKSGGLAGTGLTFIWIPILLGTMGTLGRAICSVFFICLSCAGISSLISNLELQTITLMEFGISRKLSVLIISVIMFLFGSASVLKIQFLLNQDYVWGFSLIVSGLIFISLVIRYNPFNFRSKIVNEEKHKNDFNLPFVWIIVISVLAPLQAVALLGWWIYSEITQNPSSWYIPGWSSIMTTWIEWTIFALLLIMGYFIILKLNINWLQDTSQQQENTIQMTHSVYRNNQIFGSQSQYMSYVDSEFGDQGLRPSVIDDVYMYDNVIQRFSTLPDDRNVSAF